MQGKHVVCANVSFAHCRDYYPTVMIKYAVISGENVKRPEGKPTNVHLNIGSLQVQHISNKVSQGVCHVVVLKAVAHGDMQKYEVMKT